MKHWLIAYDIRDAKRLHKVEKCVESCAWRVQKSVFESDAPEEKISWLKTRVEYCIGEGDFVLFLDICEQDWQKRQHYGGDGQDAPDLPFLVL